jgi:hypothetical protein
MLIPVKYRGKNGKGITREEWAIILDDYLRYYRNHRRPWY